MPPSSFHELLPDASFMPCSFHPHLHPSFVLVFSSHQCENTQETFLPQWDFSHIFCSLGIWMFTGGLFFRGTDCIQPHISKHFHKSGSWHALHSARPRSDRAQASSALCNFETVTRKACHHGFDEWMDIRLLASIQAVMYGVPGTGWLTWSSKAVSYLQVEVWVWLGSSGKAFGGLGRQSDKVKTAVSHYAPL